MECYLIKDPSNKVEEIRNRANELTTMIDNLNTQKENIINM